MSAALMETPAVKGPALRVHEKADGGMDHLIAAVARHDQQAFERLYHSCIGNVFGLALRITRQRETAEEVAEDVFIQIWKTADSFDPRRGVAMAWIMTICRSRALDALRRADPAMVHPDPHELVGEGASDAGGLQDLLEATQDNQLLHAALAHLSPEQRQMLGLAFFRGMTHHEISVRTGIPLGTVKSKLRRALQLLRSKLETHFG